MIIQVQEGIRSNLQSVLHALTVVSRNVVLSSLITNCIHGGTLVLQKWLIYLVNRPNNRCFILLFLLTSDSQFDL